MITTALNSRRYSRLCSQLGSEAEQCQKSASDYVLAILALPVLVTAVVLVAKYL